MWVQYPGWRMYLAHLDTAKAFECERVAGGQRIAISGNTGKTTGPHLHLSVKVNKMWQDPYPWFYRAFEARRLEYIGVHLPNHVTPDDARFLGKHLNIFKGLMRLDKPENPTSDDDALDLTDWHRIRQEAPDDAMFVLRIYANMKQNRMPYSVFAHLAANRLLPLVRGGPLAGANVRLEIHNEPNHPDEGWGPTQGGAILFDGWYRLVYNDLQATLNRHSLANVKLMWPGLAVAEWAHKERTWMRLCENSIINAPSVGVHSYWQTPTESDWSQLAHDGLGLNWKAYDDLLKRYERGNEIIVTEAGNSNCHNPAYPPLTPRQQADQYVRWCKNAARGVSGVTFFLWGAMSPWEGFRVHHGTVEALGAHLKTIG